jgi:hypothetical protein
LSGSSDSEVFSKTVLGVGDYWLETAFSFYYYLSHVKRKEWS